LTSSRSYKINMKRFSWERPLLSFSFAVDLFSRFQQNPKAISGDLLFAMYLVYTRTPPGATVSRTAVLDVLIASALQGYEPAQAVVLAAFESFEAELPPNVKNHIPEWLERGVASGSIISGTRLKQSNSTAFCTSRAKFRALGGYNWIYCTIDLSSDHLSAAWEKGYTKLHWLATYGVVEDLLEHLKSEDSYINSMTENEETPLYLACARGSWEIVRELLEHGACPFTKCTGFKISCMHWLFSFETEFQAVAATELIRCGADINAVISHEVPFLHYPFVLPSGSPLHWAVATSSHETISVLIQAGANVLLRNGVDPYVFDHRVRDLNKFDGPDRRVYSIAEIATKGLTPLDLSAMQHHPFIFNILLKLSKNVDINVVDEEGFSVLHRLSSNLQGRTRSGGAFSTLAFRGSKKMAEENLKRTITAIKAFGGNLEQLTTPFAPRAQRAQGNWQGRNLSKCTPIMLAFLNPSLEVMQALLEAGASVHTENNLGDTAIHCLPYQDPDSSGECARLLISYGANVNHKNSSGAAPILKAAQYLLMEVVEAMLCAGADIDERVCSVKTQRDGANIFSFLARFDSDDRDISVARLLQQYVFSYPDVGKRRRVVNVGDREGQTLLHCFAMGCMPRCVEALLNHGAPVNASHKRLTIAPESVSTGVKSFWHETPLDTAVEYRALRESRMSQYREWSVQTYTQILQKENAIISMLEKAGGVSTRALVVKSNYVYEGPAGGLIRFLRDGL
jgi:ankyrin repeat protein